MRNAHFVAVLVAILAAITLESSPNIFPVHKFPGNLTLPKLKLAKIFVSVILIRQDKRVFLNLKVNLSLSITYILFP